MRLLSALDDLRATTLKAITGILARLEYLAGLRQRGGSYVHWGLVRVHGQRAAQEALGEAHQAAVSSVLRTPLKNLCEDAQEFSEVNGLDTADYLESLKDKQQDLLPTNAPGGAAAHLNSVLHALWNLKKSRRATPPTA